MYSDGNVKLSQLFDHLGMEVHNYEILLAGLFCRFTFLTRTFDVTVPTGNMFCHCKSLLLPNTSWLECVYKTGQAMFTKYQLTGASFTDN